LHHVADVDDELVGFGRDVEPRPVLELHLQAPRPPVDREDRQAAEVRMLTSPDLVGQRVGIRLGIVIGRQGGEVAVDLVVEEALLHAERYGEDSHQGPA
jgi:hypothetical protein